MGEDIQTDTSIKIAPLVISPNKPEGKKNGRAERNNLILETIRKCREGRTTWSLSKELNIPYTTCQTSIRELLTSHLIVARTILGDNNLPVKLLFAVQLNKEVTNGF